MYPISYRLDHEERGRNRLTAFFRYFVVIPWSIVAYLWGIVAMVAGVIAWFALVLTARYPDGLYAFNAKFLRMTSRVYAFSYLATDRWPPFHGDPDDAYPVRIDAAPPKHRYSRLKALFRIIVGIPVMLLGLIQGLILAVVSFIAWFTLVFAARLPRGLYDAMRSALAYQARLTAYFLLLTEDYPPFSYDEGKELPPAPSQPPGLGEPAPEPARVEPVTPAASDPEPR